MLNLFGKVFNLIAFGLLVIMVAVGALAFIGHEPKEAESNGPWVVHPTCFLYTAPWGEEGLPESVNCSEKAKDLDYTTSKGAYTAMLPRRDGDLKHPFVYYRPFHNELLRRSNITAVVTTNAGGGSGAFDALAFVEVHSDTELTPILTVYGGDRCNDGLMEISDVTKDEVFFTTQATPFRLINPQDRTDWRRWKLASAMSEYAGDSLPTPPTFNDWMPYEHIINGALACAGKIHKSFNLESNATSVIGVSIHDRSLLMSGGEGELRKCFQAWGNKLDIEDGALIPVSQWNRLLFDLARKCSSDYRST